MPAIGLELSSVYLFLSFYSFSSLHHLFTRYKNTVLVQMPYLGSFVISGGLDFDFREGLFSLADLYLNIVHFVAFVK